MNPSLLADFYKVGHIDQYQKGITQIWTTWTPRSSRIPSALGIIHFGPQYFYKEYLIRMFNEEFFKVPKAQIVAEYREVIKATLGVSDPRTDHIEWLHDLGYLPLKFYSLPEGSFVPLNVPPIVVTNTHPLGFWLPNYIETIMSAVLWKPSTSATKARNFRQIFEHYGRSAGEPDLGYVEYQGHDFSMRGMSGLEDAILSGMGHLLFFSGTDTIPAILAAKKYYNAPLNIGGSVPAMEHSVMCAGGEDGEFETIKRIITQVYPTGPVSIIADTWNLWRVLKEYVPKLRKDILARGDAPVVWRPDSGNPVKIVVGDKNSLNIDEYAGAIGLLANSMGLVQRKASLPTIDHGALIYGDGITEERAGDILHGIIKRHNISPRVQVFGLGSYTYEYVTRDTFGWAMKATAYKDSSGNVVPIFKKPITDNGGKFSHRGIVSVIDISPEPDRWHEYVAEQNSTEHNLDNCAYKIPFCDSQLLIEENFLDIRKRARR